MSLEPMPFAAWHICLCELRAVAEKSRQNLPVLRSSEDQHATKLIARAALRRPNWPGSPPLKLSSRACRAALFN